MSTIIGQVALTSLTCRVAFTPGVACIPPICFPQTWPADLRCTSLLTPSGVVRIMSTEGFVVSIVQLDPRSKLTRVMDVGHAVSVRMHLPLLGNFQHQIIGFPNASTVIEIAGKPDGIQYRIRANQFCWHRAAIPLLLQFGKPHLAASALDSVNGIGRLHSVAKPAES